MLVNSDLDMSISWSVVVQNTLPAFFVLMLVAGPALAHGPTRQKVDESMVINASPEKVWAAIQNFHDMSWDPDVASTDGDGDNTINSIRTLHMKSGGDLVQTLESYKPEKHAYSIFMPHNDPKVLAVADFSSQISVTAADNGMTTVEYRAAGYRGDPNGDPPEALNDASAITAMKTYILNGLMGLKKKVESGS